MSDEQIDLLDWLAAYPPGAPEAVSAPCEDTTAEPSLTPVLLTRANPAFNMHRFYSLELATSLFGACGVVRHWGRIGTSGRRRTDWFDKPQAAEGALQDLLEAKRRRGNACDGLVKAKPSAWHAACFHSAHLQATAVPTETAFASAALMAGLLTGRPRSEGLPTRL